MYTVGFDIGGTNMRAVLMHKQKIIDYFIDTTPKTLSLLRCVIYKVIRDFTKNGVIIRNVGFAIAGIHNRKRGIIVASPNIPFLKNKSVKKLLKLARVRIRHDNDAHCFLRAEMRFGAVRKNKNVVALTLGTGLGGAFSIDGKIVSGSTGSAGEFGHMIVENGKTFEMVASEKFFKYRGIVSPKLFAQKAYAGSMTARRMYKEFGEYVGIGCANIVNTLDPEIIIIGGGISRDARLFLVQARRVMHRLVLSPQSKNIQIKISSLGEFSGAIGAASLF